MYVKNYKRSLLLLFDIVGVISIIVTYSFLYEFFNSKVTANIYGLLARGAWCIFLFALMEDQIKALLMSILNNQGLKYTIFWWY